MSPGGGLWGAGCGEIPHGASLLPQTGGAYERQQPTTVPKTRRLSDASLVRRSQQGDRRSFSALVGRYDWRLRGLAHALLLDALEMDTALAIAFLRAWRDVVRINPKDDVGAWLYRVTYNACIDQLRRVNAPAEAQAATFRGVAAGLATLPAADRVAVVLVDREGFAPGSAARILGLTTPALVARLDSARERLAGYLPPPTSEPGDDAVEPVEAQVETSVARSRRKSAADSDGTDSPTGADAGASPGRNGHAAVEPAVRRDHATTAAPNGADDKAPEVATGPETPEGGDGNGSEAPAGADGRAPEVVTGPETPEGGDGNGSEAPAGADGKAPEVADGKAPEVATGAAAPEGGDGNGAKAPEEADGDGTEAPAETNGRAVGGNGAGGNGSSGGRGRRARRREKYAAGGSPAEGPDSTGGEAPA
jgi:RNA polymerase sigma-70 factor, ECF subfamily